MRRSIVFVLLAAVGLVGLMSSSCKLLTPNHDPVILELGGIRRLSANSIAEYWCGAIDHDSDNLGFVWSSTRGSFSDSGSIVHWKAPGSSGIDTMNVVVTDGRGG